ncbi:TPA: hypothetical protein IAD41_05820 [Candidatus Scatenecus faecavium]|uniref:Uncharacterized protein n=1 Tax=Candidatus Scatenecus faecavium TaxID=2840915 RepID=A0A9D1FW40_9BACT|nr:hypothetical protein [Candidatus Scatenecus faecavium]
MSKDEIEKIAKNPKNVAMSTFLRGSDKENKLEITARYPNTNIYCTDKFIIVAAVLGIK